MSRKQNGLFAFAVLLTALLPLACNDDGPVTVASTTRLALAASFSFFGADSVGVINRARVTVHSVELSQILTTATVELDPASNEWRLPIPVPADAGRVIAVVELIYVVAGVESVEWSGVTKPVDIVAGQTASEPVTLLPGPADNLTITALTVTPDTTRVIEGIKVQMNAQAVGGGPGARFKWSSLDASIATVDKTGNVTTLRNGTARIVAEAGPRADTSTITVLQRVASIVVGPDTVRVPSVGTTVNFTAKSFDPRGAEVLNALVTWSAQDPAVADLLAPGQFRSKANGVTSVIATSSTAPTVSGKGTLVVAQFATKLDVPPGALSLSPGTQGDVTAFARDANGITVPNAVITWTSLDNSIATVTSAGHVTGVAPGYVELRATSGTLSGVQSVAVGGSIRVTQVILAGGVGFAFALPATFVSVTGASTDLNNVVYSGGDPNVIKVIPGTPPGISVVGKGATRFEARLGSFVDTVTAIVTDANTPTAYELSGNTNGFRLSQPAGTQFRRDLVFSNIPAAGDVASASGTIRFDPNVIQFDTARALEANAQTTATLVSPGVIHFTYTATAATGRTQAYLGQFTYTVKPGATPGSSTWFDIAFDSPPKRFDGTPYPTPITAGGKISVSSGPAFDQKAARVIATRTLGDTAFVSYGASTSAGRAVNAAGANVFNLYPDVKVLPPNIAVPAAFGAVKGIYPGLGSMVASLGALRDSVGLVVTTDNCPSSIPAAVSDFQMILEGGFSSNPSGLSGSGSYKGLDMVFAGGVAYGTSAADLMLGMDPNTGRTDLRTTGVCALGNTTTFRALAAVRAAAGKPTPPGLNAVEETFAFGQAPDRDYILQRYTFTNNSAVAINNLYVAGFWDFDLAFGAGAASDVAQWNPVTQAAEVVKSDSLNFPQRVALIAIGAPIAGFEWPTNGPASLHPMTTRAQAFQYMTSGIDGQRSFPSDVRHVLSMGPITLQPGESKVFYFAIVGGDDRASLNANVAAARAKAATLP